MISTYEQQQELSSCSPHFKILFDYCEEITDASPIKNKPDICPSDLTRIKQHAKNVLELRPSGPRQGNTGTKQLDQGIVYAAVIKEGGVVIAATLLAAGFVVGPQGRTIKKICELTGVTSKSWFIDDFPV